MQHDLNDLRHFVQVAEAGGYTAASRRSGVPRATLSRRVAALEEALGLRLIERSRRSFRLTAAGQALLERAGGAIEAADEAFRALEAEGEAPQGEVRLAVAPSVLQLKLGGMLADYMVAYPRVSLRIEATNRRVDLLREGFDFAIRAGVETYGPMDQVILPLARVAHVLVIAPELATRLRPTLEATLEGIAPLAWAAPGRAASWRLEGADGVLRRIALTPRLAVEDMATLRQAALRGLGMALMPRMLVERDLAEGRLLEVVLDLKAPTGRIHAVHLGRKGMRPVLRHLLDWLVKAYGTACLEPGGPDPLRPEPVAPQNPVRSRATP